ncbi:LexA-binding, inner membrane-associated putative hydrolase [Parafrankia irregularis]|uniref:LexA-binding, inner membrane-associated putative hydrolase n=1 Tax=Parafrankia irregularis TaxID=795642 RepID=A0A0S4QGC4_9ACTN|nr:MULTISPECIES: metal-dependent hydrolase [Parafrankia]MBE3200903.1 metal-dependent hydrolase [Parafrankia sp. CH37]CUU54699.1 LexA-binding, inner membrane-associated putative hydrolase [Parafrankia irregularis]
MGQTHVLSGGVAWLAAAPLLSREELLGSHALSLSSSQLIAGAVVAAGAGLLPDIDHPSGRIANTLGPLTKTLCRWVSRLSGGHRHATHSLLFAVAMGILMGLLAEHFRYGWWAALFVLVGFGLRGLGLDFKGHDVWSGLKDCLTAGIAVYLMRDLDMGFAGYAVTIGALAHLLGDCLTPRGCPLLWPVNWRMETVLVPRTNGTVERKVVVPVLFCAAVILTTGTLVGDDPFLWFGRIPTG